MNKKHVQWLKGELPKLIKQEVISDEVSQKLRQHYAMGDRYSELPVSLFTIILATIGGLLIGGGIILIFAYKWESLDRPIRTVLAFTPLVVAQILTIMALYPKKRGTAWREVSGVLLFCGVAAAISIIGQTYHISGDFQGFITWWYLLILPIVYTLRAHLMAVLMILLGGYAAANFSPIYILCLALLLPYYIQVTHQGNTAKATQAGWAWTIAFLFLVPFQFVFRIDGQLSIPTVLSLSTCLYLIGSMIEKDKMAWRRPVTSCSTFILGGYLISLSFNDTLENIIYVSEIFTNPFQDNYSSSFKENHIALIVFLVLSSILIIYQTYLRNFKLLILPTILILYIILGLLIDSHDRPDIAVTLCSLVFTLITILTSSWYIHLGIKNNSTSKLNYGLALIVGLVMFKFFIDDFSLVTRGIAFIVLGATLIGTNIWHNRRGVA